MMCKYCEEPEDKQNKPGLICEKCASFVHLTCLKRPGTPGDFSCDVFFDFTCEGCTPDNKEMFVRNKFPWVNVLTLTLHHLSVHSYGISNHGFFHYKTHICCFIDRNWYLLFGMTCVNDHYCQCPSTVGKCICSEIGQNITSNPNNTLHKDWKLCDPVKNATDVSTLMGFLTNMYTTLAMVNYPYPCDFLVPLPGQPVRYVCQYLNETLNGERLLKAIEKVLQVYANYDGKRKCVDYRQGDDYGNLDASGWDYQACTEMVMPICSSDDVIFETSNWNFTEYSQDCYKKYGVYPRENFAATTYGGDQLRYASNIVFSNGLLDPWTAGGILSSLSDSVNAVVILNGAHHLDLMASNPADPDSVKMAREEHKRHITNWLKNFHQS